MCVVQDPRPSVIASGIDGLSKFASILLPFARDIVGEFSGRDYFAVGLTNEVVAFANSIAVHPETWLDFPLPEEEDDDGDFSGPHFCCLFHDHLVQLFLYFENERFYVIVLLVDVFCRHDLRPELGINGEENQKVLIPFFTCSI